MCTVRRFPNRSRPPGATLESESSAFVDVLGTLVESGFVSLGPLGSGLPVFSLTKKVAQTGIFSELLHYLKRDLDFHWPRESGTVTGTCVHYHMIHVRALGSSCRHVGKFTGSKLRS